MSALTKCDVCTEVIDASGTSFRVTYRVQRSDQHGWVDDLDVCSPECLATAAVGDAQVRGEVQERAAALKSNPTQGRAQPAPKRRWWQR